MNLLFWRKKHVRLPTRDPVESEQAQAAIARALRDKREAERNLEEMKARTARSAEQRAKNHLAPLIWDAMRKGPQ